MKSTTKKNYTAKGGKTHGVPETVWVGASRLVVGKLPKNSKRWGQFTGSFQGAEMTVEQLGEHVQAGYAFSAYVSDGYKDTAHFISAQHIGLDFDTEDGDSSLDTLCSDEFIANYAWLAYTSPSHTADRPRARVIFRLPEPIIDPVKYVDLVLRLMSMYDLTVDEQCKDAARLWFGTSGDDTAEVRYIGNTLNLKLLPKKSGRGSGKSEYGSLSDEPKKGGRDNLLYHSAIVMKGEGVSEEIALSVLLGTVSKWPREHKQEFPESEIERIVNSAYKDRNSYDLTDDGVLVRRGSPRSKPSEYMDAVHSLGYAFSKNDMNDRPFVNGEEITDGLFALMMTQLREHNYKGEAVFKHALLAEAEENPFHPIRDYLTALEWDGEDHIARLAEHVRDRDGLAPTLLRKWFVGAVSKVLDTSNSGYEQNPMLVLSGAQSLGKSSLVRWIGSPLPEFFTASPIKPDDKDYVIAQVSYFVWEVEELNGTIRKAEVEALKAFVSRTVATYRAPYGKFDLTKRVTSSYIGTLNPDGGGFLNDPTGSRRYRVLQVTHIDFDYTKSVDIDQVWAQAVALHRSGETYHLDAETTAKVQEVNEENTVEDPLEAYVTSYFDFTGDDSDFLTTAEIMSRLHTAGVAKSAIDPYETMRVTKILGKMGALKRMRRVNGKNTRGWVGLRLSDTGLAFTDPTMRVDDVDLSRVNSRKEKRDG